MQKKIVAWNGFDLEVGEDGSITRPAIVTPYVRTAGGREIAAVSIFPARPLKPYVQARGYSEVTFMVNRKRYRVMVHRLIAMAFVDGYHPDKCVNHKNGDKLDNRVENLEWVSRAENTSHAWTTGLVNLRGENQPTAKLTEEQVRAIKRLLALGAAAVTIATVAGVSPSLIDLIRKRQRWGHVEAA